MEPIFIFGPVLDILDRSATVHKSRSLQICVSRNAVRQNSVFADKPWTCWSVDLCVKIKCVCCWRKSDNVQGQSPSQANTQSAVPLGVVSERTTVSRPVEELIGLVYQSVRLKRAALFLEFCKL